MLSVVVISERTIGMVKKGIRKKYPEFNLSHGTNLNSIILCLFFFFFNTFFPFLLLKGFAYCL